MAVRGAPDHMRKVLGDGKQNLSVMSKALALTPSKLKALGLHTEGGLLTGHLFPVPQTWEVVMRDHGGWAGVLSRAKANAARAIAAEKTRKANEEAKAAEARRESVAHFREALEMVPLIQQLAASTDAGTVEVRESELRLAELLNRAATNMLLVHGRDA